MDVDDILWQDVLVMRGDWIGMGGVVNGLGGWWKRLEYLVGLTLHSKMLF
jgi:hypothetical protein